jgi:FdhD protein
MFGDLLTDLGGLNLPPAQWQQQALYAMVDTIRLQESTYKSAGSVHACALFHNGDMRLFIEDVGRHNAIDTIAGWMWMNGIDPAQACFDAPWAFYTTGRLTSEMVLKAAQMQVPVVVSRSGITQMGFEMAQRLGLCTVGRATHKRFLCYTAPQVLQWQPELAHTPVKRAHA